MRISDWSSDVCSSDLGNLVGDLVGMALGNGFGREDVRCAHETLGYLRENWRCEPHIKLSLYAHLVAAPGDGNGQRDEQPRHQAGHPVARLRKQRRRQRQRHRDLDRTALMRWHSAET